METSRRLSRPTAAIALLLALIAFMFGSAPFTPALVLALIALPVAALGLYLGASRISLLAFFWSISALLAGPLTNALKIRIDVMLVILGACGVVLATAFLFHYYRAEA
jgi:hypothetical protein